MSGLDGAAQVAPATRQFTVFSQRVELEIDFRTRSLIGRTEILVLPQSKELKNIRMNCRQCSINSITVEGKTANYTYDDPYEYLTPHESHGVHQHHLLKQKLEPHLRNPPEEELVITLPKGVPIRDLDPFPIAAQETLKSTKPTGDASTIAEIPATAAVDPSGGFAPLKIVISFETKNIRNGLRFVGWEDGDGRYTHVYTQNSPYPGTACSLFPCIDDPLSRCPWEISIRCPRTLGDAFAKPRTLFPDALGQDEATNVNLVPSKDEMDIDSDVESWDDFGLSEMEKTLDLAVVSSGVMTDEIVDPLDDTRKTVSFSCVNAVSANQIGFAIGPFENVDLSDFREVDDDDKLGSNAVRVHAFCLPGRASEVRNTCVPLAKAVDFFTTTFTTYPFDSYKLCFVDDQASDTVVTAGLSFCSNRLLFPEDIIEPLDTVTRKVVYALASQYAGVSIVAREPSDTWVIVGLAYYMTDLFLKQLSGNNEYRFRQKIAADKVYELDVERPPLYALGNILHLDPSESEFLALKAAVVLFILDRRLTKATGSAGITRITGRIFTNSKAGDVESTLLSTAQFQRLCEKMGHVKLDSFFQQWVYGAGCPQFFVTQRFNKKKLVVEMLIQQRQGERIVGQDDLDPKLFMRDVEEEVHEVWAGAIQPVFTGPMTIRIHEADGTPYEHIVEIKEAITKFEIPYNTKYKRLKRSRRQKERAAATAGAETQVDTQDDVLLYCLGDVLQSQAEVAEWRMTDWSKDDEDRMGQESYEWIRMDADFEWISKMSINMPPYMFVSQLQQDRDVFAQLESIQYMTAQKEHPLISTILTRTLMDKRYFHGIRLAAAAGLTKCAKDELDWIGLFHLEKVFQELFCIPNSPMTRSNDFSDRTSYLVQCAVPRAIANIKDNNGQTPARVQRFFVDKLKFNDNTNNEFSDAHYVATLMSCLAQSMANSGDQYSIDGDSDDKAFQRKAINEIERYKHIDEWIASYQNVYSITALDCLVKLSAAKLATFKLSDFLQYTRPGNADLLRLKAFECLLRLTTLKNDAVLKYFLYTLANDPSLYMRDQIWLILGEGLGRVAVGEKKSDEAAQAANGLVVEQEGSTELRQAELARTKTIPGALVALKQELGASLVLQQAIWSAVKSSVISPLEISRLLDLCAIFYEPKRPRLVVKLSYPRYWRVRHEGHGKLLFSQTAKVRTTLVPPRQQAPEPVAQIQQAPTPLTISLSAPNKIKLPSVQRRPSTDSSTTGPIKPSSTQTAARPPPLPVRPTVVSAAVPSQSPLRVSQNPLSNFPPARTVAAFPTPHITASASSQSSAPRRSLIVKLKVGHGRFTPFAALPGQSFASLQRSTTSYGPVNGTQNGPVLNGSTTLSPFPTAKSVKVPNAMSPPPPRTPSSTGHHKHPTGTHHSSTIKVPAHSPTTSAFSTTNGKKRRKSETPQPAPPVKKSLKIKLGIGKPALSGNNMSNGGAGPVP